MSVNSFIHGLDFEPWCAASQWSINFLPNNRASSPLSSPAQKKKRERERDRVRQLKDRVHNEIRRSKNTANFKQPFS